ncbi:MAG: PHP domain-containing protein [Candidatus Cloacimonetes bacterium]|nr:PHP domain-containing protein [Candidatus Cloacimonadota bacterium]
MRKADLHIHTNFSDGSLSPREILALAVKNKYNVISITDHDTTAGLEEALKLKKEFPLQIIPGIEISSEYQEHDIHILAYNFDIKNRKLQKMLHNIVKGRTIRAKKILKKLDALGMHIDLKTLYELSGENNFLGRVHIANALIQAGYCSNKYEVFDKYIGEYGPAYEPKPTRSSQDVINVIHEAGGIAVLAHPFIIQDEAIVFELIDMGLDGLEVFYGKASQDEIDHFDAIAQERKLLRTGGSDFHGGPGDMQLFGIFTTPDFILDDLLYEEYK